MWSLRTSETTWPFHAAETSDFPRYIHLPNVPALKDHDCDDDFCKAVAAPRRYSVANMSEHLFSWVSLFEAKPVFVVYDPETQIRDKKRCSDAECA